MFYYVAMHYETGKAVLLAGPYSEESSAIASKDKARDLACEKDGFNWFNVFSLGRSEVSQKTAFGTI